MEKITTIRIISVFTVLNLASYVCGQTVNTGELVIAPDTQVSTLGDFENTETGDVINDGELFVYNNFHNDGMVSFSPGQATGLTLFEGIHGQQAISGDMPSGLFHVLFNNPASQPAFALSGDISISGKAEFQDGIVDGDQHGGLVTFEQGAFHALVSDHSFVDGQVRKTGNEAFDHPIGDEGYYRPVLMSAPSGNADHFTSQYLLENSNSLHPHADRAKSVELIDNAEYWEINRTNGASNIVLTLTWNEETTPLDILSEEEGKEIHIVRWDDINETWKDEGGVENRDEKTVTTAVSGYGIFTLAKVMAEEEPDGSLEVYNGVSPDGDGRNDFFYLKGIEHYPDNTVTIYNRWGVKVYEAKGYNNTDVRFEGYSDGRATINTGKLLPAGTYFYILEYTSDNRVKDRSGYLYIN
ncbi:gliding motility-associated C-terminal domain-containing protein [Sinomicrobium pectinilyticum]|uniref:Gliding motility-associated C-terminal domain-containing protein n=1 Tax=Sinomicrobium pectinilyticum TaxID=1084421 RepID=A0A3N0DR75_SINP1|nr:gliding motility-associated C-terminal domain-containing protein [Sinomicrobium pectinilyticum]RNL77976.1 gliding motility-associated C-terminal domain-containing protein [Sinomicrobium pectinilyticum]